MHPEPRASNAAGNEQAWRDRRCRGRYAYVCERWRRGSAFPRMAGGEKALRPSPGATQWSDRRLPRESPSEL
eukprot:789346-Lingulodinium_polyedra.AAC.1